MYSRNQNKLPVIPPSSPSNKKENLDEVPVDKRRKIGIGKMVGPATSGGVRVRQVLSVVNSGANAGPGDMASAGVASSDCGSSVGGIDFSSREDVERLLNEKMKGKSKMDYKGKCEQMMEYIKTLRSCIRWYLMEQEKLGSTIEFEERRYAEMESEMKQKVEELNAALEELKANHNSLTERFKKEEEEKLAAIKSHRMEAEAKSVAERLRDALSEELQKAHQEALNAEEKIRSLQCDYKRSQEYNTHLQTYNSKLQNDVFSYGETESKLRAEKATMMDALSTLRTRNNTLQEHFDTSRASQQEAIKKAEELGITVDHLRRELQQVKEDRDLKISEVKSLTSDLDESREYTRKYSLKLNNLNAQTNIIEATCSNQKKEIMNLQRQLEDANGKLELAGSSFIETRMEYEQQMTVVQGLQNRLADAELQIIEGEKLRKKLHNTILELKGNIRVFCRVRPIFPSPDCSGLEAAISYPTTTEAHGRDIELLHNGQKYPFTFDKVFNHESSQDDVFVEISQLVQSALDGYKVCIFAYGQTGSGKTYTMMGRPEAPGQKGLIPRSLEQIFKTSQSLQTQGWKFTMQASMLEIYNETIRDLLSTNRSSVPDANAGKQYTIKHDQNGNTHVSDLTVVDVCSIKEVSYLLHQAAQSRSAGKTEMNEQSSRSHLVFTLRISGVNESTEQQVLGILNLIDLAGSERLAKSGSTGDRLKETQSINKSLSSLSDVIFSLAKKEDHVPFRNSKLTYLLQPCLGGDSKTLMFVNIAPEPSSTGESMCSLRFAARVNSCEIGIPRRQTQMRPSDSRLSYG